MPVLAQTLGCSHTVRTWIIKPCVSFLCWQG